MADGINCSIVKLFDEMMSFYEESRAKHVMHALTRPFAVRFQAIVDSVRMKSMLLVRLASAYGRKEGRAVRAEVQSLAKQHQISERRMMDQMLRGLAEIKQLVSMQHNVVSDQSLLTHQHLRDLQAAAMIQMSSSDIFEDPSNVLTRQLSICKRLMQRKRKGLDLTGVWDHPSLITFGSCQKSQMMIVQGSPRVQQKAMAVGSLIADFIRAAALPMLSVLQPAGLGARICTTSSQVIKFLAVQALKARGDLSETVSDDFNAAKIAGATGSEQWERILAKAIQGLPVVYAVIDLGVLQDRHEVAALYRSLQAVTTVSPTTVFKVALISLSTHGWESASRAIFVTLDSGPISGIPAMRRKPPSRQRGARAGAGFRSSLANNKL